MFDTNKVASNIKNARIKKNMTQMNLADEMGVSYQAVSNWERGTSMPDISKLPELCKILNISFEELVGERSAKTGIAEKLMQDENEDVTLEEMAQVGELVEPDKIERKVNEEIAKGGKIPFSALVGLAPFMDKETLGRLAEEIADTDVELKKLCAIAPFVGRETMDRIVGKYIREGRVDVHSIVAVAPFLSKSTINKVAEYLIENGQADKLVAIAPFMGKELFPSQLKDIKFDVEEQGENKSGSVDIVADEPDGLHKSEDSAGLNCLGDSNGLNDLNRLAVLNRLDDLEEDDVAELAFGALEQGEDVIIYLDYMCEDDVGNLAMRALELGRNTAVFLDYMAEDDVAKLAMKALESGGNTAIFLDYMAEDDVAELAFKALETGKPIECYLDYMCEDDIKELLRKSLKK